MYPFIPYEMILAYSRYIVQGILFKNFTFFTVCGTIIESEAEMSNSFYALAFRQKYIKRWGLMRNVSDESLSEHATEVAILTHALCTIGNTFYNKNYDTGYAVTCAIFHDLPEVFTGDMPTPVKYFSDTTKESYKKVERQAVNTLLSKLPEALKSEYEAILNFEDRDKELRKIVKCADKLAALIKCIEEENSGNREFANARSATEKSLKAMACPELDYFMKEVLPSFDMTLDEMQD